MRAITGVGAEGLTDAAAHITGAFFSSYAVKVGGFVGATETSAVYACANAFDSSRVVPTGPVTVPPHVWQPIILYLGLPAEAGMPRYKITGRLTLGGMTVDDAP